MHHTPPDSCLYHRTIHGSTHIRRWHPLLVLLFLAAIGVAPAQVVGVAQTATGPAYPVADIQPDTPELPSDPREFTVIDGITYFSAEDSLSGRELWRTDGTDAGTHLVKDIRPDDTCNDTCEPNSSYPRFFTALDDMLLFLADDGIHGYELWASDGTEGGTIFIKDFAPGVESSDLDLYPGTDGKAYFLHDQALWVTDGTPAGTTRIKSTLPDDGTVGDCYDKAIVQLDGKLYFCGNSGANLQQLWISDGTEVGTVPARDLWPGTPTLRPREIIRFGERLAFVTTDKLIWISDGTEAGTSFLDVDIHYEPYSYPTSLTDADGRLFFTVYSALFTSDGTSAGTHVVERPERIRAAKIVTTIGRRIIFYDAFAPDGSQLWSSDGTTSGTVRLLAPIFNSGWNNALEPCFFGSLRNEAYFVAETTEGHNELWKTDGTKQGTQRIKDVGTYTLFPTACQSYSRPYVHDQNNRFSDAVIFRTEDGSHGTEVWRSDGTAAGTVMVKDINRVGSADAGLLTTVGDEVYFVATGAHTLWKSDGTPAGTALVANIRQDGDSIPPTLSQLTPVGDQLFFVSNIEDAAEADYEDPRPGSELWQTSGTPASTTVDDIYPGTRCVKGGCYLNSSLPSGLTNIDGTLYFAAYQASGYELWKRRPSQANAILIKDIWPGVRCSSGYCTSYSSEPAGFTALGTTVLFAAKEDTHGRELWQTSGTGVGTTLVADIAPGTADSTPTDLTVVGSTAFFAADDGVRGAELWRTDGTAAGTTLVKDINPGGSSEPHHLIDIGGTLYFVADDGEHGPELWRSDGSAAGTHLVADIRPGMSSASIGCTTNVADVLYICADDGEHGQELWRSDGTTAGTHMVADIFPGAEGSSAQQVTAIGDNLVFSANDGVHGIEPWRSDGTTNGTRMLQDIFEGAGWSLPRDYRVANGTLLFSAKNDIIGREVWAIPSAGDSFVQAAVAAGARPGTIAHLPIQYGNTSIEGNDVVVTATLPPGLEYISDASGIVPRRIGTTLTWRFPHVDLFTDRAFVLSVAVPDVAPGTRYAVELEIRAPTGDRDPANNRATAAVVAAYSTFLPTTYR